MCVPPVPYRVLKCTDTFSGCGASGELLWNCSEVYLLGWYRSVSLSTLAGPGLGPGRLLLPSRPPRCTLHTAFSPMINSICCGGCRGERHQPSDVDGIFNSSYLKADCTIIINL